MILANIFENAPEIEIKGLSIDSRTTKSKDMYFCMNGLMHDGHSYIKQAITSGAICIVHSKDLEEYQEGITYIKVHDVNETLNLVATKFYGYPSKKLLVFGITGTNGKTTTANIIKDLCGSDFPCGYIGTLGIRYGEVNLAPSLTTPDTITLHQVFHDMVNANNKAVAMEVSSHGLEMGRVRSVDFDIAIFTNLTYDHLDFHGTFEKYFEAKLKLFTNLKESSIVILNKDDFSYDKIKAKVKNKIYTYGIVQDADYRADNIKIESYHTSFDLIVGNQTFNIQTSLVATYNIYNLLAAIAATHAAGMQLQEIVENISSIQPIGGRMERIEEGQPFTVIIDFAHTPDGLEKVFQYAKSIIKPGKRIITVFGSAGQRDSHKRPIFGEIADRYCDLIILTEDDPRNESVKEIANQIKSGIKQNNTIFIEDRYDAIRQAIESANNEDCVLILGKGDETFMHRKEGKENWIGDPKAAIKCIRKYII